MTPSQVLHQGNIKSPPAHKKYTTTKVTVTSIQPCMLSLLLSVPNARKAGSRYMKEKLYEVSIEGSYIKGWRYIDIYVHLCT